jgi:hypothetical protein
MGDFQVAITGGVWVAAGERERREGFTSSPESTVFAGGFTAPGISIPSDIPSTNLS